MTKLEQAARQALEALLAAVPVKARDPQMQADAIVALREALEDVPRPPAVEQEQAGWAISYDGKTPYALWHEGDGPLLDLEVKRLGGTACKMPIYTEPQPARQPLTDDELDAMRQADNGALNFVTLREFRIIARAVEHHIKKSAI